MAHKQLTFTGADRKPIACHGEGMLHITVSGASDGTTTKLVYSHDGKAWHDLGPSVTGNGPFSADTMADEPGKFYLAIETDGAAVVVYGRGA